jgi:lipopolysaccharide export system protein LptA
MMVRMFLIKIVLIIFCIPTFSDFSFAGTEIGIKSLQINPEAEIQITSQSMRFNSRTNVTEFFTDVNVTYGQLTLSSDSLTVSQSNTSTNSSSLTFAASGPITINNNKNFIYGDKASFIAEKQELVIVGNVSLLQNGNTIFCDRLVLNLKDGIAKISGSVRTTIVPLGKKSNDN